MIKRPMKGEQIEEEDFHRIVFPVYGSRKLDGFRCILGPQALSSRLAPFRNPFVQTELKGLLREPLLDGEIVVGSRRGKGVLQRTSSGLTNGAGQPDFTMWVFDTPQVGYGFRDRIQLTKQIVEHLGHPRIRLLRQRLITDLSELREFIDESLELEYEGVIIKSVHGPYKQGKSTIREGYQLKIKPFEDAEGRVTGWYEEMENTNEAKKDATGKSKRSSAQGGKRAKGRLGGLILRDVKSGVEVRVGGGFSKEQRIRLWPIRESLLGKLVKYKKQKMGEKDKPRHPNFVEFLDFRPDWDFAE
jgi:DNA ligase-1